MKQLQIFKPGKHTASDGRVITFTEAQLKACAQGYDPALHEAPFVVGHPKGDAPAYGWAKSLSFSEGTLNVEPHQVDAQFAELVNAGRFKKISASFWLPDTPGNPKPGTLYPHHIAFLGAQAPAVQGLKSASFAENTEGLVEFSDWNAMSVSSILRSIKNFFIEKHGQETADKVIPEWQLENLAVSAAEKAAAAYAAPPQETIDVTPKELEEQQRALKAAQEKLAQERAEFAARETAFNATQTTAQIAERQRASAQFVDGLVTSGHVLPAQRDGLVAFMAGLPVDGIVEFGEGDKKVKKPGAEWLKDYLKAQPKVVEFRERAGGELAADLSANPRKAGEEIARRAVEFQETEKKAGRIVSIDAAVDHVTKSMGAQR